jgi:hypothetical protein
MTKYHSDWLSLIEISGPFISIPVLAETFPQGLEDVVPELARSLRADFEFWQENADDPAVHSAWIRLVLKSLLNYSDEVLLSGQAIPAGLKAEFPEHDETLRPDFVLAEPSAGGGERKPKLLIQVFPPSQSFDKPVTRSRWAASVETRMMELLHTTEIPLGLVTNGEQWMLVYAPRGETTGFTTWYASLWFEERSTLNAFQSLLGVRRFFGVAEEETLEKLLARSIDYQQEITDQLGLQVRHAVEILIQSLDKMDQERGGKLLGKELPPDLLYESALTVMMRMVFMLSAEERKLLPIDDPLYAENYAVSTLREQLSKLADEQGEEVLERRYDAWSRLLAAFRAVYGGIHHQDLNLPAYGGSLFDPDKYPFLEGRGKDLTTDTTESAEKGKVKNSVSSVYSVVKNGTPLPIDNRTVLHLLNALQMLQVDGEMRRLSFRALDVEQIGHVYEGLLDHKATRATEVVVGLAGAKKSEPEIPLSKVEQVKEKSEGALADYLHEATQRSTSALKNALAEDIRTDSSKLERLQSACGTDEKLLKRVLPFAGLIRMDDFGSPVVILPGSVYVTAGTTRRATGTHYTPRSLTEPIVQHTLEPLVYAGVAEGLPREQWTLRSPEELLALKICDMAMGSAGFLVQVVRYLAERLVESWDQYSVDSGRWTVDGKDGLRSIVNGLTSDEDKLIYARRLVAERCIYGVDKNPLAVEIAKLSLWLVTLAKERPFTFLDHALKCGDSLVGASEDDFLRWARGYKDSAMTLFDEQLALQLEMARAKRRELEGFVVRDVQDAERKQALLKEADAAMAHVKRGADLLTGARLLGLKGEELEALQNTLMLGYMAGELDGSLDPNKHYDASRAFNAARKEHAFHWEFEFPEVFERGGFSAFISNPPFIGGRRIRETLGDYYKDFLFFAYGSSTGNADYCALFFLKGFQNLNKGGALGLIATNTIAQGDTRQVGIETILKKNGIIYRAINNYPWPGQAAVSVNLVYISKQKYAPPYLLDNAKVNYISGQLDNRETLGDPYRLAENKNKGYQGSLPLGMGFVLTSDEAKSLLKENFKNKEVVQPYLNGEDLNSSPTQSPSRWIINFQDWSLEKAQNYTAPFSVVKERVYPERMKDVKSRKTYQNIWWQFWRTRNQMYASIASLGKILVCSNVSKWMAFVFVPQGYVLNVNLCVFATSRWTDFAVLQSNIQEAWGRQYSSTLETRLKYSIVDAFEPFPFPKILEDLEDIGETYHEHRRQIMLARQEGLTTTYNRFHNPEEDAKDIVRLRELHVEIDKAVASAYGWDDPSTGSGQVLELGHDFHETAQGVRFTVSEAARREILSRLLKLNHERYEEEQKEKDEGGGMKDEAKSKSKRVKKSKSNSGQMGLL